MGYRSINYLHIEFTGVVSDFFKFQELKLNVKSRIFHFKCASDSLVRNNLMDDPIGLHYHVSLGIFCFKLITTMFFTFKFQHFRSHPLLNNVGLYVCSKK